MATTSSNRHARRKRQVRKEDLYMFTALWMQESPWAIESTDALNVVGSVFVLPNDRVLSADCTRQHLDHNMAVHGAIRPLIKYPDKVEGCQVYLTRKPCAHCVKMLVQAGVSKVFYLPLQPEKPHEKDENKSVDALFQVSEVSREFYVPDISDDHFKWLKEKNAYGTNEEMSCAQFQKEQNWTKDWIPNIKSDLDWQEFGDKKIEEQVVKVMDKAFEWFCKVTFAIGETKNMKWKEVRKNRGEPTSEEQLELSHLSRLAQMLSNRTDDPLGGIGCVIAFEKEIVSIGWDGFLSKALYGNHPRHNRGRDASKKKYPRMIHAEQNALLCRNERNIENSVVYVNKNPCDRCMSWIYELGVKTVVLPPFDEKKKFHEGEMCFKNLLDDDKIRVLIHKPPDQRHRADKENQSLDC